MGYVDCELFWLILGFSDIGMFVERRCWWDG